MITLLVLQGPDKGKRFTLPDKAVVIGRDSRQLPLKDDTCSRRHAKLAPAEGDDGWMISDAGSSNGTYLNGQRIFNATPLKLGDQIRVGRSLLLFGTQPGVKPTAGTSWNFAGPETGMESSILDTLPAGHDSVMLIAPDPARAAQANLETLYQLSATLGESFDPERVCDVVLDRVFNTLQADRGIVLLLDEKTGEPRPVAARSRDGEVEVSEQESLATAPASSTIVNHVLETGVGVLSSNAMTDARFSSGKSVQNLKIRSALCAPIRAKRLDLRPIGGPADMDDLKPPEETLGVVYIDSGVDNHSYDTDQLQFLNAIGFQAGLALQNAKLYRQGLQAERLAAVGEATAALSHGIKNILQALRGGADVVEMGFKRGDLRQARKGWGVVDRNLERIFTLTRNLLTWSKPRTPELSLIQPAALIRECVELITPLAEEHGVRMKIELDPDVPALPLDGDGMHQVLMNLLTNAVEAMPDPAEHSGERSITVGCSYDAKRSFLKLCVGDTGRGIAPTVRKHLFQLFHSTKGNRGTGLGLPVVQKIVREHDGGIDVTSQPNQGTTFTLTLPIRGRLGDDPADTLGGRNLGAGI
jgi:signal transduction histidine kinase